MNSNLHFTTRPSSIVLAIQFNSRFGYTQSIAFKMYLLAIVFVGSCMAAVAQQVVPSIGSINTTANNNALAGQKIISTKVVQSGEMFEYLSVQPTNVCGAKGIAGGLRKESGPIVFTEAQQPAEYPGGEAAWKQFVANQKVEIAGNDEGGVLLTFVVDIDGVVGAAEVLNNVPAAAAAQAIRLIQAGGKWQAAMHQQTAVAFRVYKLITW